LRRWVLRGGGKRNDYERVVDGGDTAEERVAVRERVVV